jgi:hypothetical protein
VLKFFEDVKHIKALFPRVRCNNDIHRINKVNNVPRQCSALH